MMFHMCVFLFSCAQSVLIVEVSDEALIFLTIIQIVLVLV